MCMRAWCRQYQWIDDRGKKCKCTAQQYVDYVMSYSQKCISDESIFPTKYGEFFFPTFTYCSPHHHSHNASVITCLPVPVPAR